LRNIDSVAFGGCATSDVNYADRNNVDTPRARCIQLVRDSGYQDISTESINRDGQAEWKVGLLDETPRPYGRGLS